MYTSLDICISTLTEDDMRFMKEHHTLSIESMDISPDVLTYLFERGVLNKLCYTDEITKIVVRFFDSEKGFSLCEKLINHGYIKKDNAFISIISSENSYVRYSLAGYAVHTKNIPLLRFLIDSGFSIDQDLYDKKRTNNSWFDQYRNYSVLAYAINQKMSQKILDTILTDSSVIHNEYKTQYSPLVRCLRSGKYRRIDSIIALVRAGMRDTSFEKVYEHKICSTNRDSSMIDREKRICKLIKAVMDNDQNALTDVCTSITYADLTYLIDNGNYATVCLICNQVKDMINTHTDHNGNTIMHYVVLSMYNMDRLNESENNKNKSTFTRPMLSFKSELDDQHTTLLDGFYYLLNNVHDIDVRCENYDDESIRDILFNRCRHNNKDLLSRIKTDPLSITDQDMPRVVGMMLAIDNHLYPNT
jgi:hypothetical protein